MVPPGYGLAEATSGSGLLPWAPAEARLAAAHNYWLSTTRPDGRPHAMPVWGLWRDGVLHVGTDRGSRKARNLAGNPACVVHLESGDDVLILEGMAEEVRDPARIASLDEPYRAKYGMRLSEAPGELSVWAIRPRLGFAWREKDYPAGATRFTFEGAR
jgi:pyridoxamine 5'-phosphate oxidase-like protein